MTILNVSLYGMRHGDKDGDRLTSLGLRQVRAAAKAHLANISFRVITSSEMHRAQQTAQIVQDVCGGRLMPGDPGFGYEWVDKAPMDLMCYMPGYVEILTGMKGNPAIGGILEQCPRADLVRVAVLRSMLGLAEHTVSEMGVAEDFNLFVASHSPVIDLPVNNPGRFERLGTGDIVVYRMKVDTQTGVASMVTLRGDNPVLICPEVD